MTDPRRFSTSYMDLALDDLPSVIERAQHVLADVDFDTIVGTGFSGGVVIPALAMAMGKRFVLIRKETDDSHHGRGRLLGSLGDRWILVDDFSSTGATRNRVISKIWEACQPAGRQGFHTSIYVGDYFYARYDDDDQQYGLFNLNQKMEVHP